MKRQTFFIIIFIFMSLLLWNTATAGNKGEWNMNTLSSFSDCIIVGVIENVEFSVNPATGIPYTISTVRISNSLKGDPGTVIQLRTPGGTIKGRTRFIVGMPSFSCGEEVVLFLKKLTRISANYYGVSGWSKGKYTIVTDPKTSQKIAVQDNKPEIPTINKAHKLEVNSNDISGGIPLSNLLNDISRSLSSSSKGEK